MHLKKLFLCTMLVAVVAGFGATTAGAEPLPKVTICHIPPGNPSNAHTITISENALQAHINNHGDIPGACGLDCESYCPDDGNACTSNCDLETGECEYEPVDCGDSLLCTADSCDTVQGCQNVELQCPEIECQIGMCSEFDGGMCVYTPIMDGTACSFGSCEGGLCLSD